MKKILISTTPSKKQIHRAHYVDAKSAKSEAMSASVKARLLLNRPHHAAAMSFDAWRRLLEVVHITIAPETLGCGCCTRPATLTWNSCLMDTASIKHHPDVTHASSSWTQYYHRFTVWHQSPVMQHSLGPSGGVA